MNININIRHIYKENRKIKKIGYIYKIVCTTGNTCKNSKNINMVDNILILIMMAAYFSVGS